MATRRCDNGRLAEIPAPPIMVQRLPQRMETGLTRESASYLFRAQPLIFATKFFT
jgi:hypothetical protein